MSRLAYVSVGVNLGQFMNQAVPTTQPGVEVTYYDTLPAALEHLSVIDDGQHFASCLMQVNVDENKLTAGQDPHVVGTGTLQIQHIDDAMLIVQAAGKTEPAYIAAGKCDWNQARETIQFMQMQEAQQWAQTGFAEHMVQSYINHASQACSNHGHDLQYLTPGQDGRQQFETAVQNACTQKLNDPSMAGLTEMQKASVLLQVANEEAMKFVAPLENSTLEKNISVEGFLASRSQLDNLHVYTAAEIYRLAMINYTALPRDMQQDAMHMFDQTMQKVTSVDHNPDEVRADVLIALTKTWDSMLQRVEAAHPDFADRAQYMYQNVYWQASDVGFVGPGTDDVGDGFGDDAIDDDELFDG